MITVTSEVANNTDLIIPTGGRARGGNSMVRFAELETLFEGSTEFNERAVQNSIALHNENPRNIYVGTYLRTGIVRNNQMNINNMSRNQLIE